MMSGKSDVGILAAVDFVIANACGKNAIYLVSPDSALNADLNHLGGPNITHSWISAFAEMTGTNQAVITVNAYANVTRTYMAGQV